MFTDTHTHLYDERLMADEGQIKRAIDAGVTKMYMPNCDSNTIKRMMQMADQWPINCLPMMGVHPCYIKEDYKKELEIAAASFEKSKFYAVGEIGLDYHWDKTFVAEQKEAFETQVDWALEHNLPIVIHSRESTDDCIQIVRKKQKGNLKGIFHCFSGSVEQAKQIADIGFYLGIGGVVTYKTSNLPEIIRAVSLDRIVLETDAPYLSPVPHRGKRNESSYIPIIAEKIAEVMSVPVAEVASITTRNAENIFPL